MSTPESIDRDERTVAVENASYRWGLLLLLYALLADVMFRAGVRHEALWDLLALVVLSAGVCSAYQAREKALAHRWALWTLLVAAVAALVAAIAAIALRPWVR